MPLITRSAHALEMVARYGSIRRAAEQINAAPSAVNRQILNLEAELGVALFERRPRGMRLTDAGQILVDKIRDWQSDYEHIRSSVAGLKSRNGDLVRIGVMECLASGFVVRALDELRQIYPDATLQVVADGTTELANKLIANELDLVVAFNMPRDMGLKLVHEVRTELGAVMSPAHPLASLREVSLASLLSHPIVVSDGTLTLGPIVTALLGRSRDLPKERVVTNSIATLKSMAMQGVGVTFLTMVDVFEECRSGVLRFVPITGTRMFELLSVSVRDLKTLNPSAAHMIQIVSTALNDMPKG